MRKCTLCGSDGPFYPDARRKYGLNSWCKKCNSERAKQYYRNHREDIAQKHRIKKYGMTDNDYLEMLKSQGGVCAICGSSSPGGKTGFFHTDHSHKTGKIRGLLCSNCNLVLGLFKDDTSILKKAIDYLEQPYTTTGYVVREDRE